jgi:zinc-binding in reverse transcriptase
VNEMQNMMNNYVLSGLKVSADRIYLDPVSGGLGLINLKDFFAGLQAAWIKKAYDSTRDNWRVDLHSLTSGNCLTANSMTADPTLYPILNLFCSRFEEFSKCFYLSNDNYLESFIFNNITIKRDRIGASYIDINFFSGNVPVLDMGRISKLKVKDFFRADMFKSLDELIDDTNVPFSLVTYMRLRTALMLYRERNRNRIQQSDGSRMSLEQFLRPAKGNAKRIRNVLTKNRSEKSISRLRPVLTFQRLTGTVLAEPDLKKLYGAWDLYFIPNKLREFMYKFVNNSLPLNTRLSHFVANQSRNCTFCRISGHVAEETFSHIFLDCNTTRIIHDWFIRKYSLGILSEEERRNFFFNGRLPISTSTTTLGLIFVLTIQFLIWEQKIRRTVAAPLTLWNDFYFYINSMSKHCRKLSLDRNSFFGMVNNNAEWDLLLLSQRD